MKKVKLFPLGAVLVLAAGAVLLYRGLTRRPADPERRPLPAATDFEAIRSLPYLSTGVRPAGAEEGGVTLHRRGEAYPGYSLYTSGHFDGANLIDLEGNLLHRWEYPREEIFRRFPDISRGGRLTGLRFAHALPDLGLLAIYDYIALVRLDRDSRPVWTYTGRAHHDLWITPEEEIYLLTAREELLPRHHRRTPILVDYVTVLGPDGRKRKSYSILEMLEDSPYAFLLPAVNLISDDRPLDILHANSIEVFDGSLAARDPKIYREGNILLSLRNLSFVFIYDPRAEEIVWGWGPTNLSYQHKARLLAGGRIMIFNNGLEASRVLEVDPLTGRIGWEYRGEPGRPFFTRLLGSNQRLPNGNTLVVESETGTVFEVDPDGETVWRFVNPGHTEGTIAVIPEIFRYPEGHFTVPLPELD